MFNKNNFEYKYIRNISIVMMSVYLAFLAWRMFFHAYANYHRVQDFKMKYNLVPLFTIFDLIKNFHKYDFTFWAYNLLGNIAVFVPLGALLALVLKRCSISHTIVISFFIILLAEILQLITRVGVFDVDDIILNIVGCLLGYAFGSLVRKALGYDSVAP